MRRPGSKSKAVRSGKRLSKPAKPAGAGRQRLLSALGRAARLRRDGLGLTRQALARRAGLSERFLAQLETGHGNISVAKLDDLARALELPAAALLGAAGWLNSFPAEDPDLALLGRLCEGLQSRDEPALRMALRALSPNGAPSAGPPRVIALVGLRGAGKSTLGPVLAKRLNIEFHEIDDLIAEGSGMALSDIFALHGEAYYREAERRALRALIGRGESAVVALSGGVVTDPEAFALLKRQTLMVWLHTRPEEYMARVQAQGDYRPMRNRPNAMAELKALLRQRTPLYRQAHLALDTAKLEPGPAMERLVAAVETFRAGAGREAQP